MLEYGALVGMQGKLVRERWILRQPIENDEVLNAPEIGPVADAISLFEAVRAMRPVPIGKPALGSIAVPVIVPFLLVLSIKVPLGQLLGKLLHGLV
jgi:hypothetical protein